MRPAPNTPFRNPHSHAATATSRIASDWAWHARRTERALAAKHRARRHPNTFHPWRRRLTANAAELNACAYLGEARL
eukprot:357425-Chlamydomonas_euryale.AAC.12